LLQMFFQNLSFSGRQNQLLLLELDAQAMRECIGAHGTLLIDDPHDETTLARLCRGGMPLSRHAGLQFSQIGADLALDSLPVRVVRPYLAEGLLGSPCNVQGVFDPPLLRSLRKCNLGSSDRQKAGLSSKRLQLVHSAATSGDALIEPMEEVRMFLLGGRCGGYGCFGLSAGTWFRGFDFATFCIRLTDSCEQFVNLLSDRLAQCTQ